jgi:hypothetical protein
MEPLKVPLGIAAAFSLIVICSIPAKAFQNLSANVGGGYAANLFADSFEVGNSYIVNGVALSSTNLQPARLKTYYNLSYYEYNTSDRIDNFQHLLGAALFRRELQRRFKWGIDLWGTLKDYVASGAGFSNYRVFLRVDGVFYVRPWLAAKGLYRTMWSTYTSYGDLDNVEHRAEMEAAVTFPSRTTARAAVKYGIRLFKKDNEKFDWIEAEIGASQSIDMRTGVSASILGRFSGKGSRPLSTYFILSGITSYWDPWSGFQADVSIKRILPYGVVSKVDIGYWSREFAYNRLLRERIQWLTRRSGRTDEGWLVRLGIGRQYNLNWHWGRAIAVTVNGGYLSNDSDDPFYKYENYFADAGLEFRIF